MRRRGSHHSRVGGLRPRRTAFDLSYDKKFDCYFGQLIPVMHDECVPGDHFTIRAETVVRLQPMVTPVMHEINVSTHYFFVPYRLLWKDWENFISGGPDGKFNKPIPRWKMPQSLTDLTYTLWDYMGFPTHFDARQAAGAVYPINFPQIAYGIIWNEYYRDENFQPKIGNSDIADYSDYDPQLKIGPILNNILQRFWTKDYFTSALPFQQRGEPVAFPIRGTLPVIFRDGQMNNDGSGIAPGITGLIKTGVPSDTINPATAFRVSTDVTPGPPRFLPWNQIYFPSPNDNLNYMKVGPSYVNLQDGVSFDINDLRLAVQLQKWMERNARGGVRYKELLITHFGVSPRDDRLQRPEYIGGTRQPVIVSEVLQTSSTVGFDTSGKNTPQGSMAGHGVMAGGNFVGKYFCQEYGLIMGLMSVTIPSSYEDGINRQWLRYTNTDFYWPEFVNLSEQGIFNAEIYSTGKTNGTDDPFQSPDMQVWGFQPQYDEMRIKPNMVVAGMRVNTVVKAQSLSYWHMGRAFSSLPPLNRYFIRINPDDDQFRRPFNVTSAPPLMVTHANIIKAIRPLPYIGEPGLMDHH